MDREHIEMTRDACIKRLRQDVWKANMDLVNCGLVILTWGNVSAIDREHGIVAIKPSGVSYENMQPGDICILDLAGNKIDSRLNPSSDTPTHLVLYRAFPEIGAVVHTHSTCATAFAQAGKPIPCMGTTHADNFYGTVPCTRAMYAPEIAADYEAETGNVIIEHLQKNNIDPLQMPAVLIKSHGPFTWGRTASDAVEKAYILENVAQMALHTLALNPAADSIDSVLLDKHFLRKHGPGAYYGQGKTDKQASDMI